MRKHEHDILLMCDVAHKVMRNDTVYDLMKEVHSSDRDNFQNNFKQKALGLTVLTAYNNKTYRVDDIEFEKSPLTTFDQRGTQITLKDYYRTVSIRTHSDQIISINPCVFNETVLFYHTTEI